MFLVTNSSLLLCCLSFCDILCKMRETGSTHQCHYHHETLIIKKKMMMMVLSSFCVFAFISMMKQKQTSQKDACMQIKRKRKTHLIFLLISFSVSRFPFRRENARKSWWWQYSLIVNHYHLHSERRRRWKQALLDCIYTTRCLLVIKTGRTSLTASTVTKDSCDSFRDAHNNYQEWLLVIRESLWESNAWESNPSSFDHDDALDDLRFTCSFSRRKGNWNEEKGINWVTASLPFIFWSSQLIAMCVWSQNLSDNQDPHFPVYLLISVSWKKRRREEWIFQWLLNSSPKWSSWPRRLSKTHQRHESRTEKKLSW